VTPDSQPVESTTVYLPATMRAAAADAPDAAESSAPEGNALFLPLLQD
jgi:hypothetical protein